MGEVACLGQDHSPMRKLIPGMVGMGEFRLSMMSWMETSTSSISVSNSRIRWTVCRSSRDLTGIVEPIEALTAGPYPVRNGPWRRQTEGISVWSGWLRRFVWPQEAHPTARRRRPCGETAPVSPALGTGYRPVGRQTGLSLARSRTLSKRYLVSDFNSSLW